MPRRVVLTLGSMVLGIAFACGPRELPAPPFTRQPTSALVEVPFPPPPARVESVPLNPNVKEGVWIDGEWIWQTRRWAWKPGRWVTPPPKARFAPWTAVRDRMGTLYVAHGTWRDAAGAELPEPEPLAISGPAPAVVVTPEGDEVRLGPNAPLDAGPPSSLDDSGAGAPDAADRSMLDASNDQ